MTGVRSDSTTSDSVILTSSYVVSGITYAGLYDGSLAAAQTAPDSAWHPLTPVFAGQTVTSSTFYGPDSSVYDPRIPVGNVVAVGSYKYNEGSSGALADHGMIYEGPITGGGTWTQIDATPLVPQGDSLLNTIAHSTMGNLVVGNYDTQLSTGHAFIYNKVERTWTELNPNNSVSCTAYGIWQIGDSSSTRYTICGGYSALNRGGADNGYLVDYDSSTGLVTHFRSYSYNNKPLDALVSHFDGITLTAAGYNLTGDYITASGGIGAFFASVAVSPDNSFSEAHWTQIAYPGAQGTSGNTVVENKALGIFITSAGTQSYIATVAPSFGVSVTAKKSGTKATFTIQNTGDTSDTFDLSRVQKVTNSYSGPSGGGSGKPAFKITYTVGGANVTSALEAGSLNTGTLAPGDSVQLVEKVKAKSALAYKRTIKTTIKAASEVIPSQTGSAKASIVLDPK